MALFKRKGSKQWWVRFTGPDGCEIRRSARTTNRKLAQELEDRLRVEQWRVARLGDRVRRTWQEAVVRYIQEQDGQASLNDQKAQFRCLDRWLRGLWLDEVTRDRIDEAARARKADGVSNATVNRLLQVARAILRRAAREWEWIDRAPAVRLMSEGTRRVRWLTHEEAERLLAALPPHLATMARFSLCTGLREQNVTGLEWSQVDLKRKVAWVHPDQAKAKKAIAVPLNADAVDIIRGQIGRHTTRVFTYRGRSVKRCNTKAWTKGLRKAEIKDFRWHDLRHTWASWHAQAGTPLNVLQELGGWSTYAMVLRYAHLSAAHLAEHAERIRTVSGTVPEERGAEVA